MKQAASKENMSASKLFHCVSIARNLICIVYFLTPQLGEYGEIQENSSCLISLNVLMFSQLILWKLVFQWSTVL